MSAEKEKERFSALVKPETLQTLDDEKERRELSRSKTLDRVVEEWREAQRAEDEDDGRTPLERVAERLPDVSAAFLLLAALLWLPLVFATSFTVATGILALAGTGAVVTATMLMGLAAASLLAVNRPLVDLLPSPLRPRRSD